MSCVQQPFRVFFFNLLLCSNNCIRGRLSFIRKTKHFCFLCTNIKTCYSKLPLREVGSLCAGILRVSVTFLWSDWCVHGQIAGKPFRARTYFSTGKLVWSGFVVVYNILWSVTIVLDEVIRSQVLSLWKLRYGCSSSTRRPWALNKGLRYSQGNG